MGSHSVTCHPTEVRIPHLWPAEAGTRFSDPGGIQGWVDLCYVKTTGRELNLRPVNGKSNALPLSHHANSETKSSKFEKDRTCYLVNWEIGDLPMWQSRGGRGTRNKSSSVFVCFSGTKSLTDRATDDTQPTQWRKCQHEEIMLWK